MATPPSSSTPVLDMPTSPDSTKESCVVPDPPENRKERRQRIAAAGVDPEPPPEESELASDSLSEIIPTAVRLHGSLGSVEQPKERRTGHLMPPRPVGTGADISLISGEMPTLEDDSEGLSIPPLQPQEEDRSILADAEEVWETWIADHVLSSWDPYGPIPIYVRKDSSGYFHTYPSLGGPFRSLEEVGSAVVSRARGSGIDTSAELSELTPRERLVRKSLYWPDGTIRLCTRAETAKIEDKKLHRLVKALLDKYNDNQDDNKDCVGELEDIVHWQSISEGFDKWYYHLNIRLKTKVAADDAGSANLFFAEVARDQMRHTLGYYISALSPVGSKGDGAICHGCRNNGSTDMKHPLACDFKGGHKDICFPRGFGPCNENQWRNFDDDEGRDQEMKKAKIQNMYKYLDDADYMEGLRNNRIHNRKLVTMEMVEEMFRDC